MFYSGLTELDEVLSPKLALAESIEHDKATIWTIKLRKGVQFHDGKELTAEDVVFSLKRHHDPATASKAGKRHIADAEIDRNHRSEPTHGDDTRESSRLPGRMPIPS